MNRKWPTHRGGAQTARNAKEPYERNAQADFYRHHTDGYDAVPYPKYVVTLNDMDVGIENGIKIVHLQDFLLADTW